MEVLAARDTPGATLSRSDRHKTAGQLLFTASGLSRDPREKVYDIQKILASPTSMTDSTTGLSVPTTALTEIDCAREQLAAMANDGASAKSKHTDKTGNNTNGSGDTDSATDTTDVNATDTNTVGTENDARLRVLLHADLLPHHLRIRTRLPRHGRVPLLLIASLPQPYYAYGGKSNTRTPQKSARLHMRSITVSS